MLSLPHYTIAGLDYGSKLAGTTVLAVPDQEGYVHFFASSKGRDADAMLAERLLALRPRRVFIDAPLSLPGAYLGMEGCSDYFFRLGDRELRAMSPMFLGGLTARAIQLKNRMLPEEIQFLETYPAGWVRTLPELMQEYRTKTLSPETFSQKIVEKLPLILPSGSILSWHHADALIALVCGIRYENQVHTTFGSPREGEIVI